jgi:hypothetical protein
VSLFQESRVEGTRKKIRDVKRLAFSREIRKYDGRATRKLPDDLAAGATRWCQRFRISHNRKFRKLSLTFGQRFPDRNSFRANGQPVTCTLDIASGVDLPTFGSDCRPDEKV